MVKRLSRALLLALCAGFIFGFFLHLPWLWVNLVLIFAAFAVGQGLAVRKVRRVLLQLPGDRRWPEKKIFLPAGLDAMLKSLSVAFGSLDRQLAAKSQQLSASKQELELLLTSIEDCVLLIDSSKNILLASGASAELLGWQPEELKGQHLFRVIRTSEMRKKLDQVEQTGAQQQLELQAADHCLKGQITPITGGQYLIMLADCTDKERLDQLRRDFASNVSHELRTPLTSVQGFVDTLLDGAWQDPEACQHFLKIIKRETARLTRLVADLLDLSRLETRRLERPIVPVDLGKVARRVSELVEKRAQDKGLKLQTAIAEDFPLVMGDKDLLHQVLLNLLDNAISYTEEGFVELRATLDGKTARIEVADSGPGISPEDQERIFERFYRVDKARSRHAGGTGLGLAIARFAVERMGGKIGLESQLGRGSTFWVELPVTSS